MNWSVAFKINKIYFAPLKLKNVILLTVSSKSKVKCIKYQLIPVEKYNLIHGKHLFIY